MVRSTSKQRSQKGITTCCKTPLQILPLRSSFRSPGHAWGFTAGMNQCREWIQKHGYHPSRTVDHVLTETSYNSDTPACQRHKRPCHLPSIQYLGDQRYSDTGLWLVALCEWCNPLLSKYRAIHETIWNYMNVSNLQRRSIPLKICFRNPVVAPIFSFNTIPRMLPVFSKCGKIQCQWNMFYFSSHDIPPQFSANGETSARWQFFGGKDLHFKTAKGLTRETLRIYIYHIYVYIYVYIYRYQNEDDNVNVKLLLFHFLLRRLQFFCPKIHILSSAQTRTGISDAVQSIHQSNRTIKTYQYLTSTSSIIFSPSSTVFGSWPVIPFRSSRVH